ncbi:MAG: hypothetical protein DCF19_18945 [Pseudanabaena frigida]|uniref:Acyltransferase 3 domain-containing protein n=1 Tax=Pseudanabaena frigida TaxID=945775 RepID=A0A2W4XP82_9CYAN|nr:MAG: hypothetical protein DCF19_18945 [Pseudanabaena frigida]
MTWELSDLLRAIATTLVIGIHASHHWWFGVNNVTNINFEIFIDTIVNQVGRFTVPIFVILSGYALSKSEEKRPFDLKIFVQRRLWRIVPPYVLFTLLNVVGRSQFRDSDWLERGQQIWQAIATGMGDYHLYFLGIILQCYVCYPFLRHISFSVKNLYILLIFTFSLFSLRWSTANFGLLPNIGNLLSDGNHVIYWLPYFQIGIWLAKDREWTNLFVAKWRSRLWGYLFAIAATLELSEFYWMAIFKNSAEAIGHYTRPTVVLMTLSFLLWSISWKSWQSRSFPISIAMQEIARTNQNPNKEKRRIAPPFFVWVLCPKLKLSCHIQDLWKSFQISIKTLANASFTTYLIHVWILRAIAPLEIVGGILFVLLAAVISWLIGITVWKLVKTKRWIEIILGA